MVLKLPYIPGRDIKEYCDRHGIKADKKDCQRAAIAARKIERKVLGEYHKPVIASK